VPEPPARIMALRFIQVLRQNWNAEQSFSFDEVALKQMEMSQFETIA
jgi:hypothetical protein